MTEQQIASALRSYAEGYAGNIRGMCAVASNLIETLVADRESSMKDSAEFLAELTDLRKIVPRWISVEERLPEDGEDVLVHIKYNDDVSDTKVAHRVMKKWYLRVAHRVGGVVTHWMPLPEPPK